MASKDTYVVPPRSNTPLSPCPDAAVLLPLPDIQRLTSPGDYLCIGIYLCMLTFIRLENLGCGSKKTSTQPPDQY